jgi:hypothetical protein
LALIALMAAALARWVEQHWLPSDSQPTQLVESEF